MPVALRESDAADVGNPPETESGLATATLTFAAMIAFAANSILCRMGLRDGAIDPASYTLVRIVAGALFLAIPAFVRRGASGARFAGSGPSAALLFAYAVTFSYAYMRLSAGTGALVLFGAVQATMIIWGLWSGERLPALGWTGLAAAFGGLVFLVSPGIRAPSPVGFVLMAVAGISWGLYSVRGRREIDPLAVTAGNFARAAPMAAAAMIAAVGELHVTPRGVLIAAGSGALASACGYVIWYAALRRLTATRAAAVQLAVPIIAALGGVALLAEPITPRLQLSSLLVLGGIALVMTGRVARQPRGRST